MSKGKKLGVDLNWSVGQSPVESFGSGDGIAEQSSAFNGFAFNELSFNDFVSGSGGASAIPVTGKGVGYPLWKFATGEAK